MKFRVKKSVLFDLVNRAQGCVPIQPMSDIFKMYMFEATDILTLRSVDIDMSFVGRTDAAEVIEKGSVCLPAKKINDIIKVVEGDIQIELSPHTAIALIKSKSAVWKIVGLSGEEFPETTESLVKAFDISRATLVKGLRSVAHAVCTDESRANMLMVQVKDGSMYATDGKRIAIYKCTGFPDFKIPAQAVGEVTRLSDMTDVVNISVEPSNSSILFGIGRDVFYTRQLSASFVDLGKVLKRAEEKADVEVRASKKAWISALSLVEVTLHGNKTLSLTGNDGKMDFVTEDEMGSKTKARINYKGGNFTAFVDLMFVGEAIKSMDKDEIVLKVAKSQEIPLSFEGESVKCLVFQKRI